MDYLYFVILLQLVFRKTAAGNQFLVYLHRDPLAAEFQQIDEYIHASGIRDVPALSVDKNTHKAIFNQIMNYFRGHFTLKALMIIKIRYQP